jgi:hypothetical protein
MGGVTDFLTPKEQATLLGETATTATSEDDILSKALLYLDSQTTAGVDGMGFSKKDQEAGQALAAMIRTGTKLSPELRKKAATMVTKYWKQLLLAKIDVGAIKADTESCDIGGKSSQADILIELAQAATLFHDDLQEPFARVEIGDHWETWPVRSKFFRRWLARRYYDETGKAPNSDAISQALNVIEARAVFDGPEHKLNLRVAEHRGVFWYDLADAGWRAVKITPEGWQVVNRPPILFRRYQNTAPQVEPRPGGNLLAVLDFMNLQDEDDQVLLVVYLVTCLVPGIPHPAPVLHGEKGAAKSTALRVFRRLVDPARRELLTMPKDQNELALIIAHNYMPAFDNLDGLQPWQSDMLCCAATGGGISKRELYTNEDEVILDFLRCPTLDGINLVATRPDLLDRALIFGLERIDPEKRREESEFWRQFEEARPAIVGGMFDALAGAMRIYPKVKLARLPRMADFCRWGYAVAEALGIGGKKFLDAYYRNIGRANEEAISANPVAAAIVTFMQGRNTWEGTAAELLDRLEEVAGSERINTKSRAWPQAANSLTRRLKQVKSNLLDAGISYDIGRNSENRAVIILRRIPENTSGTSGTSGTQENQALAARRYSGDIPEIFKTSGETSGKPPAPEANSDKHSGDTGDTGDIFGTSLGDDIDDIPF